MGRAEEVTTPDMRRKQDIIRDVVLKVAAQLSPEAAIEMDLTFGELLTSWPAMPSLATAQPAFKCSDIHAEAASS